MSAPLPIASRWNTYSRSRYPRLWDGCVGAWCPSLGVTGTRLFDFTTRQNWGTLTNMDAATDWIVDGGGYALDFDGSDDMVEADHITAVDGETLLTATAWIRTTAAARRTILNQFRYNGTGLPGGEDGFYVDMLSTGVVRAVVSTDGSNVRIADSTGVAVNNGVWRHVALVRTAVSSATVYVDGVARGTNTISFGTVASITNPNTFQIGGESDRASGSGAFSSDWLGQIDDVRIYARPLHREEIRLLARRRAIAYEPAYRPAYYSETDAGGGGVAKPVLFHNHYMSQGMRP